MARGRWNAADRFCRAWLLVDAFDDLDEALSALAANDITPDRTSEIDGICRQAFLTDPAGNQVELNQPL